MVHPFVPKGPNSALNRWGWHPPSRPLNSGFKAHSSPEKVCPSGSPRLSCARSLAACNRARHNGGMTTSTFLILTRNSRPVEVVLLVEGKRRLKVQIPKLAVDEAVANLKALAGRPERNFVTTRDVAKHFGVTPAAVLGWLKKTGIDQRLHGTRGSHRRYSAENLAELEAYRKGLSQPEGKKGRPRRASPATKRYFR
jgi:hypothetical protein